MNKLTKSIRKYDANINQVYQQSLACADEYNCKTRASAELATSLTGGGGGNGNGGFEVVFNNNNNKGVVGVVVVVVVVVVVAKKSLLDLSRAR
jgi:hypothetical protein